MNDNTKMMLGLGLLLGAGAIAYFVLSDKEKAPFNPYANNPYANNPNYTPIPPGSSYQGTTNNSSQTVYANKDAQIISATGDILASAGKATADILSALNKKGATV